ncbi:hypothetical protein KOW79_014163 [Hemibagrus wyckioides]|uniref:Ig-like domain-containing protein n=1 Tax=Hemibagrus wyckioides TaxID=337641 RepID=A0A9D3NL30_9TELE|nr:hypothetical protein KOW79_014163 [Hemibagrus wyckioides]
MMLLLWTFVASRVVGETMTGGLHGRVELQGRYGHNPDVEKVEWTKYAAENSTRKLLYVCDISDDFELLQWFRNDLRLPDDRRFSLTEKNKTMQVFNLISSDCGTYTCVISNEYGTSAAYVDVNDDVCEQSHSSLSWFCEAG